MSTPGVGSLAAAYPRSSTLRAGRLYNPIMWFEHTRYSEVLTSLILLMVLAMIVYVVLGPRNFQDTVLYRILVILGSGATIFIVFYFIYKAQRDVQIAEEKIDRQTALVVDRLGENMDIYFQAHFDSAPRLIMQMYPETPFHPREEPRASGDRDSVAVAESNVAIHVFQTWEDYRTLHTLDTTGELVWISYFLHWSQSDILFRYWKRLQANFALSTILFGNLLFQGGCRLRRQRAAQGGRLTTLDYWREAARLLGAINVSFDRTRLPDLDKIEAGPEKATQAEWRVVESDMAYQCP